MSLLTTNPSRRDRYLWYLYDFANSIIFVSVLFYFSLWAVVDNGMSQWIVSLPISLSTLVLLIVMPGLARRVDQRGLHKQVLLALSFLAVLALLFVAFLNGNFITPVNVFIGSFIFYICYQSALVFFTSFLKELSNESNSVKISGIGHFWGQIGNLCGMLLSFATIGSVIFGITGKQQVFLWAAISFAILLIPLFWFRNGINPISVRVEEGNVDIATFKKILSNKMIFWFLIAYILYADAMLTLSFFLTLYWSKGLLLPDDVIKIGTMCMLLGTIIGALLTTYLQRFNPTKSLKIILILWPILILMCALVVDKNLACILFGLLGVLFASSFAICRSFYSTIIPAAERAEYFSVYVIFERIGAVIGPLIWSLTVSSFMFLGESTAYRIAMACTAIITSISIFALEKVRKIQISAQSSLTN